MSKFKITIKNLKLSSFNKKIALKDGEEKVFVWTLGGKEKFEGDFEFVLGEKAKLKNIFLFSGAGRALYNVKMRVVHKGDDSVSENIVRGVLGESARAEILGETIVAKDAAGTSSWLEEKALLFGCASARLDPRLEIKTNDVKKAGHAGTTTRIRDDELFYMTTRGITKEKAERLKMEGFLLAPIAKLMERKDAEKVLSAIV